VTVEEVAAGGAISPIPNGDITRQRPQEPPPSAPRRAAPSDPRVAPFIRLIWR
jgi:hypothetical protein